MAKILYGVCGEGFGHASRSRILINYLKNNHEIKIVAGGKAYTLLSKEFNGVYKIETARFLYKENKVRLLLTILRNSYKILVSVPESYKIIKKIIKDFKPDLIITDAEPICHHAAIVKKIKSISIDNPHALIYRKYKVGFGQYLSWIFLILSLRISLFGADKYIVYDFFDSQISNKKVLFLKPLIQEGILKQKTKNTDIKKNS